MPCHHMTAVLCFVASNRSGSPVNAGYSDTPELSRESRAVGPSFIETSTEHQTRLERTGREGSLCITGLGTWT